MKRRDWETWIGQPILDAGHDGDRDADGEKKALTLDEQELEFQKERFHSLYLDMVEHLTQQEAADKQRQRDPNLWKKAALAVWLNLPKRYRQPRTQAELAGMLGYTNDRTLRVWRQNNPNFFDETRSAMHKMMAEFLPDVMWALTETASRIGKDGTADRKMFLEMVGMYKPKMEALPAPPSGVEDVQFYIPDNGRGKLPAEDEDDE